MDIFSYIGSEPTARDRDDYERRHEFDGELRKDIGESGKPLDQFTEEEWKKTNYYKRGFKNFEDFFEWWKGQQSGKVG